MKEFEATTNRSRMQIYRFDNAYLDEDIIGPAIKTKFFHQTHEIVYKSVKFEFVKTVPFAKWQEQQVESEW